MNNLGEHLSFIVIGKSVHVLHARLSPAPRTRSTLPHYRLSSQSLIIPFNICPHLRLDDPIRCLLLYPISTKQRENIIAITRVRTAHAFISDRLHWFSVALFAAITVRRLVTIWNKNITVRFLSTKFNVI